MMWLKKYNLENKASQLCVQRTGLRPSRNRGGKKSEVYLLAMVLDGTPRR